LYYDQVFCCFLSEPLVTDLGVSKRMAFNIYKRGQGKYTRLATAFGCLIIAGSGCMQLYKKLDAHDLSMWVETMVPVVLFGVLSALIFVLVNKVTVADFMIAAEGEMKKVSWSSRREIMVSTFIVIMFVFLMAVLIGGSDFVFFNFFGWLLR